jgi:transposase
MIRAHRLVGVVMILVGGAVAAQEPKAAAKGLVPRDEMTAEQRSALERMARSRSLPRRKIVQARALLLAADGVPTNEVARRCHTTDSSVRAWRRRFADHGVEAVGRIAPGRGRKRSVSQEIVEKIVHDTMYTNPDGGKPWTATLMGERFGISDAGHRRLR